MDASAVWMAAACRGRSGVSPRPNASLGPIGLLAPRFCVGPDGGSIELEGLLGEVKPVLVVYANPDSPESRQLLPAVAGWQREHASKLTIVIAPQRALGEKARRRTREHASKLVAHSVGNPPRRSGSGDGIYLSRVRH